MDVQAGNSMRERCYSVYGALVNSDIDLPELDHADGVCDISIRSAEVPISLASATLNAGWFETDGCSVLIRAPGVARYLVRNGNEIIVDVAVSSTNDLTASIKSADVRLYLLGSAFGALMHQRAWLPLHVSAVKARRGVWAFTGESGAGKSTLAAWLHRSCAFALISDDVSVLKPDSTDHIICPGPRKMKLWRDAVDYLDCGTLPLVQDLSNTEKYQLYLSESAVCPSASLHALVLLEESDDCGEPHLQRLTGGQAFAVCKQAIYRPEFAGLIRNTANLMDQLAKLCRSVEVYRFSRRKSFASFTEQHEPLLSAMRT
jgi:hypothetical protein